MTASSQQSGFSLIEMIVSLALFSIVITISVGALLMLIGTNEQLQGEQSVMTNLSFALDSMAREIRTGTNYYCNSASSLTDNGNMFTSSNNLDTLLGTSTRDCSNGNQSSQRLHGFSFKEAGDSVTGSDDRILYYFDSSVGQIFRRIGSQAAEPITSSGIYIDKLEFFVTGSKPLQAGSPNNADQASVTIFIKAREANKATAKSFYIQTTVGQRTIDI